MKERASRIILLPFLLISFPLFFVSSILFLFFFFSFLIFLEFYRNYRYLEIRKNEIIEKVGIIKIRIKKAEKKDITNIIIVQGPIARIFNYGDVIIKTFSEELRANYVFNPKRFLKLQKL